MKQLLVSLASLDTTVHETRDGIVSDIQSSFRQTECSNEQNQISHIAEEASSRVSLRNVSGRSFDDRSNGHTRSSQSLNEAHSMQAEHGSGPVLSPLFASDSRTARITLMRSSCVACGYPDSRQLNLKSPNFLNSILGSLFVGYRTSPWSKQACDHIDCRQASTTLTYTYIFPQWLLNRVFFSKMVYNSSRGPELCLRVMRVRPADADIFLALWTHVPHSSRLDHVKRLLNDGQGSVLDVGPDNYSVLSVS